MKKQRKTLRRKVRPIHGFSLETLEDRNLLAANVLATADDSISTAGGTDTVDMTVSLPDSPSGTGVFSIRAIAATGGGLDPAAPVVRDAAGLVMTGTSMDDADGTTGMTVVELGTGEYTLELSAEGSTTGAYTVEVSLLGDVGSDDGMVNAMEKLRATAAYVQAAGTGNHVTDLLFQQNGIDPTVDQYDAGMDVNMNGAVDASELGLIESNASTGTAVVTLQADSDAPVISGVGLTNDTGVSSSDRISTDPTIAGSITEQNTVVSVVASLDGGPDVDITGSLGDISGGSFTLTPAILDTIAGGSLSAGDHVLQISATDDAGNVTSPPVAFSFTFIASNLAPTGTDGARNRTQDLPGDINLNAFFSDPDADDVLTFSATGVPAWLTLNPATGLLTGTPTNDDVGSFDIMATATDSQGLTATATVSVNVVNVNDEPIVAPISPDPQQAFEDTPFSLDIGSSVSDPDTIHTPDTVTISVDQADSVDGNGNPTNLGPLPAWLTYDEVTGILSGTPTQADVDNLPEFGVLVTAVDEAGASGFDFFMITVAETPEPPFLAGPAIVDQMADQDSFFSVDVSGRFDDPDGADTLSFTATADGSALPAWLFLNASTGVLSGTPGNSDVGTITITVTATDNTNLFVVDDEPFMLTVNDVNDAPLIADQNFSIESDATAGTSLGTVVANDPDVSDTLTFAVTGGTGTADFDVNPNTGQITVAAGATLVDQSVRTLEVEVTDSGTPQLSATATMTIAVGNQTPTPVGDDAGAVDDTEVLTIAQSDLLSNDTDPDGDALTLISVSPTSALGATVRISGADIFYDPISSAELIGLAEGEFRNDSFTYTVTDPGGATAEATVDVRVDGAQSVAVRIRTFDASGNEISTITPGAVFEMRAFIEDISVDPMGVFSAFIDVAYNVTVDDIEPVATINGEIVHSSTYMSTTNGTATPGLIDEVGGLDGFTPLGGDEFELFRLEFIATGGAGQSIDFSTNPSDTPGLNGVLLFGPDTQLADVQIDFGGTSLAIVAPSPLSGGESSLSTNTNPDNAYDVNDDDMISPMDALMVINRMAGSSLTAPGSVAYVDVNADGGVSPLDALMVINRLGTSSVTAPIAPLSGSASLTDADDPVDSVFADLGNEPASDFGTPHTGTVINQTSLGEAAADEDADDDESVGLAVDLLLGAE